MHTTTVDRPYGLQRSFDFDLADMGTVFAGASMLSFGAAAAIVKWQTHDIPFAIAFLTSALLIAFPYELVASGLTTRGSREVVTFVTFGPCLVIGSVLLLGGSVTREVVTTALCLGLLATNAVLIYEPFERRLTARRATSLFATLYAVTFALPILAFVGGAHVSMLGLLGGIIPADYAVFTLRRDDGEPHLPEHIAAAFAYVAAIAGMVAILVLVTI